MRFKFMENYRFILVTGPQRSGTIIAAKMISTDTRLQFLPEGAMAVQDKDLEVTEALPLLIGKLRIQGDSAVIQCPIQCRYIHEIAERDTLVVMMRRPIEDIVKSEKRIGWGSASQRALYSDIIDKYDLHDQPISVVKYFYWDKIQRMQLMKRAIEIYELRYNDLQDHPLWLDAHKRQYFQPRQIAHDEDYSTFRVMI